jgi:hypothetical protein
VSDQATGGPSPHDSEASWAGALRPLASRVSRFGVPWDGGQALKPGVCGDPMADGRFKRAPLGGATFRLARAMGREGLEPSTLRLRG